jgi:hypothetical protein
MPASPPDHIRLETSRPLPAPGHAPRLRADSSPGSCRSAGGNSSKGTLTRSSYTPTIQARWLRLSAGSAASPKIMLSHANSAIADSIPLAWFAAPPRLHFWRNPPHRPLQLRQQLMALLRRIECPSRRRLLPDIPKPPALIEELIAHAQRPGHRARSPGEAQFQPPPYLSSRGCRRSMIERCSRTG